MNNNNISNLVNNMNAMTNISNENANNNINNMNVDINNSKDNHNKMNNNNDNIDNDLKVIQDIHDHPLILSNQNYKLCNICLKKLNNTLAYGCNSCLIIICQECIKDIFNEKININLDPHIIKLKYNPQKWTCIKCNKTYDSKKCISLYCDRCNLNYCDICYLSKKYKERDYSKKENDSGLYGFCCFCNCQMEKTAGYIVDNNPSRILCKSCHKKIFIDGYNPKISYHCHKLELILREIWRCDKCKKYNHNRFSFHCSNCNYDLCYDCYYSRINLEENEGNKNRIIPIIYTILFPGAKFCSNQ
jgi:hypothetical protein